MKSWLGLGVLVALIAAAVLALTAARGPGAISVGGPTGLVPGDTLAYTLTWGAAPRATGYRVTLAVSGTNGAWTATGFVAGAVALPASAGPSPGTSFAFGVSAIPWDSATFTATVESADAQGVTGKRVTATWRVQRRAGTPGPITVDSSKVVVSVSGTPVYPSVANVSVLAHRVVCAFKQFSDGAVAEWTADRAACDSIYRAYVPASQRLAVTAVEQAHTDSVSVTCVSWASLAPAQVSVTPRGPCSAAADVAGLAVTGIRQRADQTRAVELTWRTGR